MPNYKALYLNLFNSVTDTIERLKQAQQEAERLYLEEEEPPVVRLFAPDEDDLVT